MYNKYLFQSHPRIAPQHVQPVSTGSRARSLPGHGDRMHPFNVLLFRHFGSNGSWSGSWVHRTRISHRSCDQYRYHGCCKFSLEISKQNKRTMWNLEIVHNWFIVLFTTFPYIDNNICVKCQIKHVFLQKNISSKKT